MQGDGIVAAWFAGFSIRHRRGCCLLFLTLPLVYSPGLFASVLERTGGKGLGLKFAGFFFLLCFLLSLSSYLLSLLSLLSSSFLFFLFFIFYFFLYYVTFFFEISYFPSLTYGPAPHTVKCCGKKQTNQAGLLYCKSGLTQSGIFNRCRSRCAFPTCRADRLCGLRLLGRF
jgi:hypothetical protein